MGIRAKLIASISTILVLLTVVLAVAFAVREQRNVVELKRDHLRHSAELAATLLPQRDLAARQRVLDELNNSHETGPTFQLVWSADHDATPGTSGTNLSRAREIMTVAVPLTDPYSKAEGQLIAAEPLPDTRTLLMRLLAEHLLLGGLLTAAAALAVALVCQRVVVQPVRWLVGAADSMAKGERWEPIHPENRRRDEIGVLGDHLAALSRRLSSAVRNARHGSAHLVAVRVRREMEEPLRALAVGIATLEAVSDNDADLAREVQKMGIQLQALRSVSIQLADVQPEPGDRLDGSPPARSELSS